MMCSDLHAEECIPVILEAANIVAMGVNCIPPALVAPTLQVQHSDRSLLCLLESA